MFIFCIFRNLPVNCINIIVFPSIKEVFAPIYWLTTNYPILCFFIKKGSMGNAYFQVKTRQQIAHEYGISSRTLRRWLNKAEINLPNRLLGPNEQILIYKEFGNPNVPT
jgi:hypothetical protein